ncbi:hypothetical protein OZX69_09585 (plasmid) [Lactobacillus sp. ESL0731]|uniref:hypothetical protein n=1 Tax=unclassified Lactobacillus TaxID=2620435 RepID=UPI0023F87A59|nr:MULTISPECIES: hypothetical protein [unclassified Lactobacillus]WEV52106.1 hypothetical protein OZX63_09445 [Lactobacillus sp. ESL0700]WEV63261.1 hypothetical protein OZX69_09585 [Lactobacillus sp. ESL0731]
MKLKVQISIALIIAAIGLGTTGYFKLQQDQIDSQTAQAKIVLQAKKRQLKNISDRQAAIKITNDPAAKANYNDEKNIKLLQNNANAFFKLLYNVNHDQTQTELDTRNKNLPRYATTSAISDTGLDTKSVREIKQFNEVSTHIETTVSASPTTKSGIYSGIIDENSTQSSINIKGKHNQDDWYLFEYDSNNQKFTKFTLLGFNFTHDNG